MKISESEWDFFPGYLQHHWVGTKIGAEVSGLASKGTESAQNAGGKSGQMAEQAVTKGMKK